MTTPRWRKGECVTAATCRVSYQEGGAGGTTTYRLGVLARDDALGRYIALQLEPGAVTGQGAGRDRPQRGVWALKKICPRAMRRRGPRPCLNDGWLKRINAHDAPPGGIRPSGGASLFSALYSGAGKPVQW